MFRTNLATAIICATVTTLVSSANAADTAQRKQVISASRANGVGSKATTLLRRGTVKRGQDVLQRLLSSSVASDLAAGKQSANAGKLRVENGADYLAIDEMGSSGELYRTSVADAPIPIEQRRADDDLIDSARAFIVDRLAPAVGIDAAEIYPLKVRHQVHASGSRDGSSVKRQVVSSEVVFGRKIGGIAVVGPGSKISVELSPQGKLVSFKFDWSAFVPTAERVVGVSLPTILQRANAHTLATATKIDDYEVFECGYYDAGASDGGSLLQAGCLVQKVTRDAGGHILDAREEVIPAGTVVKADAGWWLATKLAGGALPATDVAPPAGPERK